MQLWSALVMITSVLWFGVVQQAAFAGEGASELLHIGQAVVTLKGTVDYFINTVFNIPTLAECYKAAAFNGLNKLTGLENQKCNAADVV